MTGISLSGYMPYMTVASLEMSDEPDKILSNHTHELAIYSINMPLVNEVDIRQSTAGESINNRWYLYAIGILLLLVLAGFVLYRFKYNGKNKKAPPTKKGTEKTVATTGKVQSQSDVPESKTIPKKEWMQESETIFTETVNYYDRSQIGRASCRERV